MAAKKDDAPVGIEYVGDHDNVTSSGLSPLPDGPVVTEYDPHATSETVVKTPTEPVTMSVSWLSEAETKVVGAPAKPASKPTTTAETA
jgi:hypothetical protein